MRQRLIALLEIAGDWGVFAGRSITEAFRPPFEGREIVRQLFELGCRSMPLIAAAGFAVLETRRTFLNRASLLVWARKNATE